MKPFQLLELSNEDYHSSPEYIAYRSRSKITRFINHGRCGLGLERRGYSLFSGNAGTTLGSAVDAWFDAYCRDKTVTPCDIITPAPDEVLTSNGQRRGNRYKQWAEELAARGGIECSRGDMEKVLLMTESLKANRLVQEIVEKTAATQRSIFWETDDGHKVKIRADGDDGRVPYDLKTTSADFRDFPKKGWHLGYADQAALYVDGFVAMGLLDDPTVDFRFVVVQSVVPYRTRVLHYTQEVVDAARARVYNALNDMRDADETGDYRDVGDEQSTAMELPQWVTGGQL